MMIERTMCRQTETAGAGHAACWPMRTAMCARGERKWQTEAELDTCRAQQLTVVGCSDSCVPCPTPKDHRTAGAGAVLRFGTGSCSWDRL